MKGEPCGKIMTEFAKLRPKTYCYLEEVKRHKNVCHKTKTYI